MLRFSKDPAKLHQRAVRMVAEVVPQESAAADTVAIAKYWHAEGY